MLELYLEGNALLHELLQLLVELPVEPRQHHVLLLLLMNCLLEAPLVVWSAH